jgi:hypothetical protein
MRRTRIFLMLAVLPLAGCASNQGGTSEAEISQAEAAAYQSTTNVAMTNWDTSEVFARPAGNASPFAPGMNPRDLRDPHYRPSTPPGQLVPPTYP